MTVALLLTGFIRDPIYINNIVTFYNNIIDNKFNKLHIYYSCPSKLEEFDVHEFDKEYILSLFNNLNINNIEFFINFRKYDNEIYIEKAKSLRFPKINNTKYFSYRVISCLNGFSETSKIINNDINYDFVVYSRLDIIGNIVSIDKKCNNFINKTAYIYRTIPYRADGVYPDVEDRFFICSQDCVKHISNLDISNLNISNDEIVTERILSKLFNTLTDTNKLHIDGLIVNNEFINYQNSRIRLKYSPGYMKMCEY
jgi:hypothetical protein